MAKTFQRTETIICWRNVKDTDTDEYKDPATSMKITITGPTGASVVASTDMTKDSIGHYHYDYNPASDALLGKYEVRYIATDGARLTKQSDNFILE